MQWQAIKYRLTWNYRLVWGTVKRWFGRYDYDNTSGIGLMADFYDANSEMIRGVIFSGNVRTGRIRGYRVVDGEGGELIDYSHITTWHAPKPLTVFLNKMPGISGDDLVEAPTWHNETYKP